MTLDKETEAEIYNLQIWKIMRMHSFFNEAGPRDVVRDFKLKSCYYENFRTNTLEKGMNTLIPTSYGLKSITAVLLYRWLWHCVHFQTIALRKGMNPLILPAMN